VPPVAEIRVSADGYETRTFSLQVSGNISQTFALPFDGVRPSLSGNYALFFESVTCAPSAFALPAELRQRVWDAEIVQNGSQLKIKLSGAPFRIESGLGDNFTGVVLAGGAQFFLQSYVQYFYYGLISTFYPSVAERLPDNRYLVPQGDNVILTGSAASGLSGTFNGSLALWDANFPEFSSRQVHGCSGQTSMRFVPR
jgi:hypothetical protein